MKHSLTTFSKPQLPSTWDYYESVERVKRIVFKWSTMTQELLKELWIAREKLRAQGRRTDRTSGQMTRSWEGYCKDIGSSKRTVNRWLVAFQYPWQNALLSGSPEWYTPNEYLDSVHEVLGEIDLDPASCGQANKTVKAYKFYSKEDDGLSYPWYGKIFLNPPYGNDGPPFVQKLIDEFRKGNVTEAILLVNARSTDAKWYQPLFDEVLCFTNHRLDFDSPDGKEINSTFGSCFVYFGKNRKKFVEVFSKYGAVVEKFNGQ